jgi:hypothetical protein
VLYTVGNIYFESYKVLPSHFQKTLIWERYECPKFWDSKSPSFETPTWESWGKVTFGCNPHREAHNIL